MPVSITWDNDEKTVLRYDISDPWTWTDFFNALKEDDAMIASVDHRVHLLFNIEGLCTVPASPIAQFRDIAQLLNPGRTLVVVSGKNQWFRKLVELFSDRVNRRLDDLLDVGMAETLEEARRFITHYDWYRSGA